MHCEFKQNEELKNYSTIKIGGKADFIFLPKNINEIFECLQFAKKQNLPVAILGNGSNTLCSTNGFKGVVLCTKNFNVTKFRKIKFKFSNKISFAHLKTKGKVDFEKKSTFLLLPILKTYYVLCRASCGVSLPLLSNICFQKSLTGLEFACSIPATIGGAVKMNAGAFGGEVKDIAFRVLILNIKTKRIYYKFNANCKKKYFKNIKTLKFKVNLVKNSSKTCFKSKRIEQMLKSKTNIIVLHRKANFLQFDYRYSSLEDDELVLYVDFLLKSGIKQEIGAKIQQNKLKRQLTQNVGYPNLGSVFKKCGITPAKVIDEMGLKGLSVGGAMVSKVHSGFVVNVTNATSDDVLKLLKKVRNLICKKYKIMLQYEIRFLGDFNGRNKSCTNAKICAIW